MASKPHSSLIVVENNYFVRQYIALESVKTRWPSDTTWVHNLQPSPRNEIKRNGTKINIRITKWRKKKEKKKKENETIHNVNSMAYVPMTNGACLNDENTLPQQQQRRTFGWRQTDWSADSGEQCRLTDGKTAVH